jgi:hypothetical protein
VMKRYRVDNTSGYTQDELDTLNRELSTLIKAAWEANPLMTQDNLYAIVKGHGDDVAKRSA